PRAPGAGILFAAEQFSAVAFALFLLFPLCAVWWWLALWRRQGTADRWRVEVIGALTLVAGYDLVLTTLGSYGEYPRLHLAFDPLMLVVVVGSLLPLAQYGRRREVVARE